MEWELLHDLKCAKYGMEWEPLHDLKYAMYNKTCNEKQIKNYYKLKKNII